MIRIGTRGSELALVQARAIAATLTKAGHETNIQIVKTKGDVVMDRFDKIEGKGFFTAEIERALLDGEVDLAVHCLKDLPTSDTEGLKIAAITEREDPRDLIIASRDILCDDKGYPLLHGMRVGTSSMRRVHGLTPADGKVEFVPIRGNVPTRIAKMERGEVDAVVLACAGVNRLNLDLEGHVVVRLEPEILVPAPGQGALALQTRADDELPLSFLHHDLTDRCVRAERRVLQELEGGCQLPFGMFVRPEVKGEMIADMFLARSEGRYLRWRQRGASAENLCQRALEALSLR